MKVQFFVAAVSLLIGVASWAQQAPVCMANGQPLPVNNDQILAWKTSTANQFKSRGHIQGTISSVFANATGHNHFQAQIGPNASDVIEVIYNEDFGSVTTTFQIGDQVEACGDYITATQQAGPYPPSPDGAILHWVHQSPSPRHDSGFMMVNGTLYGQDAEDAGPKRRW